MTSRTYNPRIKWADEVQQYLEETLGEEQVASISTALCTPPCCTCLRVNTLKATPQEVLEAVTFQLKGSWNSSLPYIHTHLPAVILPGVGPLAVDYSEIGGKEVVVSRKCGEAVLRGAPVYIPGVLACSPGVEKGDLVAVAMVLERPGSDWCGITRGTIIGSEAWQRAGPPNCTGLYIGVGRSCVGRTEMFRLEQGLAITMHSPVFRVPSAQGLEGKVMFQNLPSLVAAAALAPRPGSRVLDMCAAPGGKTTMIAQLMGDKGEVVALDRSHAKVQEIQSLAQELGITIIKAYKMDATKAVLKQASPHNQVIVTAAPAERDHEDQPSVNGHEATAGLEGGLEGGPDSDEKLGGLGHARKEGSEKILKRRKRKEAASIARGASIPQRGDMENVTSCSSPPGFPPCSFDHVLVDAPCSALGLRPRLLQTASLPYLKQCAVYQRRILDAAVQLLKPGGTLVFSTCTFNPGENESNVRYVLDTYADMHLEQQWPVLGGPGMTEEDRLRAAAAAIRKCDKEMEASIQARSPQPTDAPAMDDSAGNINKTLQQQQQQQQHKSVGESTVMVATRDSGWLSSSEAKLVQRFDPRGDTIGFFVAKFRKKEGLL
ncbi:hypothetical protein CEUSTIGMA_g2254.t1 [Chlamydomonas eustigma]|uniref:SAM-dependent MTase RsmB/NOP-type domain-containing protein n=1 Tax=Chlamydomonas eustigma TaxID=1157962 RepID=A0A250WVE9_9CHLO|nr:hypothetical protein CEUSTIGMA_g2254.t1 [Chlamydomonas eustigma]|eukprot:GAX74807.1 hypothetical protein CEUSTIGMA_g2254.t1 [Chlamydomonas eustigma]